MTAEPVSGTEGWPAPLSTRFTVHRALGRGRFGAVFEATDLQRGARVAVKVLAVDRPEALQAFKREFRALADLAHENLVALHELGREGDTWFLVMECIEGDELISGLKRAPERTLNVFAQMALGLGFLHSAGRLHRDLKPANVRLTPGGRAVLLDFGLTVVRGASEGEEGLVGSAAYISPEQASGADATPASDLYALGVMLCEVLLGRRPFVGSGLEVLAAKRAADPKLEWPDAVPAKVRELVVRLLSRDPAQRPTVEQLVATLDESLVPLLELRPEAPLVGRDEALAALDAEVRRPGAAAVWVTAAPGVGKSALLRRFMSGLEREVVVFASTCFEHETTPFRAVDGVVDGLARWLSSREALPADLATHAANLARSFPALRHVRCLQGVQPSASLREAHRHESAMALRALLSFVAQSSRVVVVIDDLHWADADSVPLLRELLEGANPAPVLFVGAMREEGNALLEPLLEELESTPLSPPGSGGALAPLINEPVSASSPAAQGAGGSVVSLINEGVSASSSPAQGHGESVSSLINEPVSASSSPAQGERGSVVSLSNEAVPAPLTPALSPLAQGEGESVVSLSNESVPAPLTPALSSPAQGEGERVVSLIKGAVPAPLTPALSPLAQGEGGRVVSLIKGDVTAPLTPALSPLAQGEGERVVSLIKGAVTAPLTPALSPLAQGEGERVVSVSKAAPRRRRLRLAPLSPEASRALVAALAPKASDTDALINAAAGNPFLLHTLAGHGGVLEAAVEARVSRVPRASRRLLEAVCLTGAPLPRKTWSLAGALDIDEALALGHLRAGRLVRVRADGSLEPYHDTLRRAVVGTLPAATRVERHGGLAEALRTTGAEPELLAEHLHGAGRTMEAAEQAVLAARRAAETLAFHHAARLYGQALEWRPESEGRRELLIARGRALANVGRGEEAAEAFLRAAELPGPSGGEARLTLEQAAAAQLLRTGHIDRGLELTRQVLAAHDLSLGATPRSTIASIAWTRLRLKLRGWKFTRKPEAALDPRELARIDVLTSSSIGLAAVDSLRAADLMGRALLRALSAGEPRRLAVCLGFEVAFSGNGGGRAYDRTMLIRDHALRLANELGDDYAMACCLGGTGIAYFHLGQLSDALDHLDRASNLFLTCVGAVKELFTLQLFALAALAQQGRLGELGRRLVDHVRLATERGDRYAESNLRSGLPNLAWLGVDDVARARHELELARPGLQTRGYSVQHFFELLGRFQVELYAGDGQAATRLLDEGLPALEGALLSRTEWISIAIDWMKGRARLASGSSELGPVLTSAARIEKRRRPWGDALASSLRAGVLARRGQHDEADAALEAVVKRATAAELGLHALAAERLLAVRRKQAPDALDARARELGVLRLDTMARVYLPGFEPTPG